MTRTVVGAGVATAGLAFGLLTVAQADEATTLNRDSATTVAAAVAETDSDTSTADQGGRGGAGETALTGTEAEQATAAALAAVPGGTVIRVETDNDGDFEAHVSKSDGTEVVVKMDASFTVTSVDEFAGRGAGRGGAGETALTGTEAEQATAAALAAVPGGTVIRVETDNDGDFEAHVSKSDGTEVVVKMDASFTVTSVDEFAGHGGHHGRGPHGGPGPGAPADDSTTDSGSTSSSSSTA